MKPGETPYESAARILKRELGFGLNPKECKHVDAGGRFYGVGAYSYTWDMRQQAPQTNGTADISVVLVIECTAEEIAKFKIDNQEYEMHEWVDRNAVIEDVSKHIALRCSMADFAKKLEWIELTRETSNGSDGDVGKSFKLVLAKWKARDELLFGQAAVSMSESKKSRIGE